MDMDVSVFRHVLLDSTWRRENVPTPFNRFYFVEDGSGTVTVNGETVFLRPGNIYLIPVNTTFSYACDDALEKTYLHVNFRLSDGRDLCQSLGGIRVFENRMASVQAAHELFRLSKPERTLRLHALVLSLLCEITSGLTVPKEFSPLTEQALSYIELHYASHPTEAEIAAALFVSADTLRKTFRKELNIALIRYARQFALKQAERLLRTTDLPIQEIARRTGFADPLYFSRAFSSHYGISPKAYRDKNGT